MRTSLTRHLIALALASVPFALTPLPSVAQSPAEVQALVADAAERHGVSAAWALRIVRCETGGTWNPRAVGDGGNSLGIAQLHRRGLLPRFYAQGYSDPFDAAEAADFLARSLAQGLASHWSCR